ncbi:hypothetical protein C1H46_002462 [Malus baccata]|uniref:LYR motif containing domain-containing protein n=1 Tax=Malus baccata TaxID=106549 RepID=A0A540NLE3_MALBA|nr:hypothetical protein C1H46_002462 [Malus baccata]
MRPIASSSSPPTWLWPFSIPPGIRSTTTLFRPFSLLHQKVSRAQARVFTPPPSLVCRSRHCCQWSHWFPSWVYSLGGGRLVHCERLQGGWFVVVEKCFGGSMRTWRLGFVQCFLLSAQPMGWPFVIFQIFRWRCGRDFGFNGFDGFEFNGAKLHLQTNDICTQPASMPPLCPVSNVLATIVNLAARLAKKAEARAIFMLAADERSLHNVDDSLMLLTTLSP